MSDETPPPVRDQDHPKGLALATGAYLLWGFLPLYMKAVGHISPLEVISHRVLWSVPIAGLVLVALGKTRDIIAAIRNPRMLMMASLTATMVSINWGFYIWSISVGRALDAALGYFINPLFSILLGAILLKERMSRTQVAALLLAAVGVAIMTWESGQLPWLGLILTLTWGCYAFLRKALPLEPNQGFFLEVVLLTPFALAYLLWIGSRGEAHFLTGQGHDTALLLSAGIVTAVPLMLYANGAKLLRLSTIAIMQYMTPSMLFLIAVFIFREPINGVKLTAFAFIWSALALYTVGVLRAMRKAH